jgi:hypothetical protein
MTPQSEKYVDGSASTSVDDMRRGASTTAATAQERSDDHQRRNTPVTDPTEPTRYAFECPDEAGYPTGKAPAMQQRREL